MTRALIFELLASTAFMPQVIPVVHYLPRANDHSHGAPRTDDSN